MGGMLQWYEHLLSREILVDIITLYILLARIYSSSTSSFGNTKFVLPLMNHCVIAITMTAARIGPAQFKVAAVAGMKVGMHKQKTQYQPHAKAKMLTTRPHQ